MKRIALFAGAMVFFMGICTAWADSTIESATRSTGFRGNGGYEGTIVSQLQGDKKFEASSIKFTGAVMSWLAGGGDTGTITRLDKGVVWTLDPKKKVYKEEPIVPFKSDDARKKSESKEKPKMRISKSEFSVKKTGAKETINSFPCEEYVMTWLLEFEDIETKAKTTNTMTTNLWTTPETAAIRKAQAEEMAFTKAYMKKIGLELSQQEMKQFGMEMFSAMSGASKEDLEKQFKTFKKEMAKLKGYPIRTVVNWSLESDQAAQAKSQAQAEQKKQQPQSSPSINPFGGLSGLLGSVAGSAAESAKPAENAPFFSSTVEVKSIKTDPLPASSFEIPEGFTRK
jgi:hypothetical protein